MDALAEPAVARARRAPPLSRDGRPAETMELAFLPRGGTTAPVPVLRFGGDASITLGHVPPGSHRRIWWLCRRFHLWDAPVYSITSGVGCPYCAGKRPIPGETDLATTHPRLAAEWDHERNGGLRPEDVSKGTDKYVWWRCEKGHGYRAKVFARAAGSGCPYCANKKVLAGYNDLATTVPRVAREWYAPLNGELTPESVTSGSKKKVWWQCAGGHVWLAAVYSRTRERASGCPVCMGKVKPHTGR